MNEVFCFNQNSLLPNPYQFISLKYIFTDIKDKLIPGGKKVPLNAMEVRIGYYTTFTPTYRLP